MAEIEFQSTEFDFDVSTQRVGQNSNTKTLTISYDGKSVNIELDTLRQKGVQTLTIGRADENIVKLQSLVAADYQATLAYENGTYYLYDGQDRKKTGQYQPSDNGLVFNGRPIKGKKKLENGDVIKIRRGLYTITLLYYDLTSPKMVPTVSLDKEITIGRNHNADLALNYIDISNYHARITPKGKGHQLEDLGSTNGTFIDGQRLASGRKHALQTGQKIKFAGLEFQYDGQSLCPVGTIQAPTKSRSHRLDAVGLKKQVPARQDAKGKPQPNWVDTGKIALLSDISLVINPGEFVALVGGSGAGKSTLLDALNASRPVAPKAGKVLIDGKYDLYKNFDKYREYIGYVPQKDIVHEHLNVGQVLKYAAQLRQIPRQKTEESIKEVLTSVHLSDKRGTLVRELSGGQKKRVSIAVELIGNPEILFLDEPTSGLDPGLDKHTMEMLRDIAHDQGKTVVLVTHATENITECDMVAFLAYGGRLVYFGPPNEACSFFGVDRFSLIYQLFDEEDGHYEKYEKWEQKFKNSPYYANYVEKRHNSKLQGETGDISQKRGCLAPFTTLWQSTWPVRQMGILFSRYWAIMLADKARLGGLALFAPLLAALVLSFPIEQGIFTSDILKDVTNYQGVWTAMMQMQQTIFIMACIGTFFGLFGAIQEISKERHIYDRENLANLNITSYVCSKLLLLSIVSFIQAFFLVYTLGLWAKFPIEGVTMLPSARMEMVMTMFLTLLAATSLGLLVSAWVEHAQDRTLPILAILVIIQIVFGGVMFKLEGVWQYLTWLGLTRWSTEALGISVNLGGLVTSDKLYLSYGGSFELYKIWFILLIYTLLFFIGTIWILQRQDITRSLRNRYANSKK